MTTQYTSPRTDEMDVATRCRWLTLKIEIFQDDKTLLTYAGTKKTITAYSFSFKKTS